MLGLGLPIGPDLLAWAFEMTPEGIKKAEADVEPHESSSITHVTGQKFNYGILGLLLAWLVGFLVVDQYVLDDEAVTASSPPDKRHLSRSKRSLNLHDLDSVITHDSTLVLFLLSA